MKSILLTLSLAWFVFGFSDSDILGSQYNLGKIPEKRSNGNALAFYKLGSEVALMDVYYSRAGKNGKLAMTVVPGIGAMGVTSGFFFLQAFPYLNFLWKAGGANRFSLSTMPLNLFVATTSSGGGSGLNVPFTVLNDFSWQFISRNGSIRVSPDEFETAFLLGPQLNPGQLNVGLNVSHTVNTDTIPYGLFGVNLNLGVGIVEGLVVEAGGQYLKSDSLTGRTYVANGGSQYYGQKSDSLSTEAEIRFRTGRFFSSLSGKYGQSESRNEDYRDHFYSSMEELTAQAGLGIISGDRITKIEQVRGNWDDLHSTVLGSGQWLNTLSCRWKPIREVRRKTAIMEDLGFYRSHFRYREEHQNESGFLAFQSSRLGFLDGFEIGEMYSIRSTHGEDLNHSLNLKLAFSSIPLREYGPSQADDHEYFHGYSLKQNDVTLTLDYALPFFKDRRVYDFVPIYERIALMHSFTNLGVMGRTGSGTHPGETLFDHEEDVADYDLSVAASWGVTDWLTLSHQLGYQEILYTPNEPPDSENMEDNRGRLASGSSYSYYGDRSHPTSNRIIQSLTTVRFNVAKNKSLSLSYLFAGQSDTGGWDDKEDYRNSMLLFLYQGELEGASPIGYDF